MRRGSVRTILAAGPISIRSATGTDLIKDIKFGSWNDLWSPELKGKIAAPDFDPSHLIVVAAILSGGDAEHWQKGEDKLKALKPNFKAFYTDDANSQQLLASGETPVQDVLSMNAYYMIGQGVSDHGETSRRKAASSASTPSPS